MNMFDAKRAGQRGEINILLIPFVFMTLFFMAAAGFGAWAYMQRQDFKNNTELKIAEAVDVARKDEAIIKDREFAEIEKQPLTSFRGPDAFGGIEVIYPKTWSVYINSSASGNQALNAFLNPRSVPSTSDPESVYALRIQVLEQSYETVVKTMAVSVKTGKVTAVPIALPRVPSVVGTRFDGSILSGKKTTGVMVVLPLRDKTIKFWTESPQFTTDFNTFIIPNLSFSP